MGPASGLWWRKAWRIGVKTKTWEELQLRWKTRRVEVERDGNEGRPVNGLGTNGKVMVWVVVVVQGSLLAGCGVFAELAGRFALWGRSD